MSQPFIGEIRMFGGNFAPQGWMFCHGQLLPIAENDTLFNLIGTTYGGDGQTTFALPDLQSRVPIHQGTNNSNSLTYQLAENGGTEEVTLTTQQIPIHTHIPNAAETGASDNPAGNFWASSTFGKPYVAPANPAANVSMNAGTIQGVGGSQPHDNMIPFLCINYIISLFGVFPLPN